MLHKLTLDEQSLIQELQSSGIPINFRPLKTESRISPAITLRQTEDRFNNGVHLPYGYNECCVVMTVAISNRSNRNVRLEACRLKIPSGVADFRWLEKPRGNGAREFAYSHDAYCSAFGGPPIRIEPERVLNHQIVRGLKVFPGETLEGMLIGAGDPELHHYPNRQDVGMELVIVDSRGGDYHLPLVLKILRKKRPKLFYRPRLLRAGEQTLGEWLKDMERRHNMSAKAELEDKRQAELVEV